MEGGGKEGREGDTVMRRVILYLFKAPGGSDLVVELIQVDNFSINQWQGRDGLVPLLLKEELVSLQEDLSSDITAIQVSQNSHGVRLLLYHLQALLF